VDRLLSVRPHRWLAALPTVLMLGGAPFANRVEPYVFGLPFLLAWIVGCVLLTSVLLAVVRRLDRRAEQARGAARGNPRR
jgi:beta-lactamase regulating signal transducer with metallopeptidase domain